MYNSNTSDINGTLMVLSIQEKAWPTRVYQPRLFGVQYSVIYWHCGHLSRHIHIICRGFETLIWRQIKEIKKIMFSVQKKKTYSKVNVKTGMMVPISVDDLMFMDRCNLCYLVLTWIMLETGVYLYIIILGYHILQRRHTYQVYQNAYLAFNTIKLLPDLTTFALVYMASWFMIIFIMYHYSLWVWSEISIAKLPNVRYLL